ncbi:Hypp1294 [Branchiostoma lanceolatum]|uniref:Hypp1294 protein n=1 Tax=Branchiostoma lanceolatum TaxID=7740 RepID=A0A8J9ZIF5_BRALA|nr:Hypp1294 [Branchiostoma lanceolatum]
MITKTSLLLLVYMILNGAGQGMVFTGECRSDDHCIRYKSLDTCCAFWGPKGALTVCKKLGEWGQLCQVNPQGIPYPFGGREITWLCPCGFGLTCQPLLPGAKIGTCHHKL